MYNYNIISLSLVWGNRKNVTVRTGCTATQSRHYQSPSNRALERGGAGNTCRHTLDVVQGRAGEAEAPDCEASCGQEDSVGIAGQHGHGAAQGSATVAAPEEHNQVPVQGERSVAAQNREGVAEPDRDSRSRACEAALNRDGAVEKALWAQERAAEETALRAPGPMAAPQRPGIEECPEELTLPPDACVCARCGQTPYAPNGVEESTLFEIEVKAYKRAIQSQRWRRICECASSPVEVSAPPAPRLFRGTPYGIRVWARFLFELCAGFRPVHRIAAWMSAQGLVISPGTLADSPKRFEPPFKAILAPQNKVVMRHADETSWQWRSCVGKTGRAGPG